MINNKKMNIFLINLIIVTFFNLIIKYAEGHGMMLEPPGRSSRWRFNSSAPANYDDNQLYCGGLYKQWYTNKGKCGLCGDDYSLRIPRPNEIGGKYGEGIVVRAYRSGNLIPVGVKLTANHQGYFYFHLCDLDRNYETESCYRQYPLRFIDGKYKFYLKSKKTGWFNISLRLPEKLICNHCVLRWTYYAGNNWGTCPNGTQAIGCGPQENFRSCADIQILPNYYNYYSARLMLPQENSTEQQEEEEQQQLPLDYLKSKSKSEVDNMEINNSLDLVENFIEKEIEKDAEIFESKKQRVNTEDIRQNDKNEDDAEEFSVPNVPLPILISNKLDE